MLPPPARSVNEEKTCSRASAALLVSSIFLTWIRSPPLRERVLDARGRLLRAALGFAGLPRPSYDRALASPYLLSGLGRCALCGGSLIAMSRHHGRRRGFFYGCAYNSKRGPTVCRNHLHMSQEAVERAVLDAVATALDPAVLEAAIDRAMELLDERREANRQRQTALEQALRTIRTED